MDLTSLIDIQSHKDAISLGASAIAALAAMAAALAAFWSTYVVRRDWKVRNTPDVYPSVVRKDKKLYFVLENFSDVPAVDVEVRYSEEFNYRDRFSSSNPAFTTVPYIPPRHAYWAAITTEFEASSTDDGKEILEVIHRLDTKIRLRGRTGRRLVKRPLMTTSVNGYFFGEEENLRPLGD